MKKAGVLGALAMAVTVALVLAVPAGAITYGTPTGSDYGNVGALVGTLPTGDVVAYCTGTLISPTVLVTAAHCGDSVFAGDTVCVTFSPVVTTHSKLSCGAFVASPLYSGQQGDPNDLAVVVFDKPVKGITPATVTTEGYLDELKASGQLTQETAFTTVGYGTTEYTNAPGGPTTRLTNARLYSVGRFNSLGPGVLHLTQNPATGSGGTCNGDSGGPVFLDGVLVAITVTGDTLCKATSVNQRLDTAEAQAFLAPYLP